MNIFDNGKEKIPIRKLFSHLRFYGLGQDEYRKCMKDTFPKNIFNLRWANAIVAVLAACFASFPIIVEHDFFKAIFYFGTSIIALLLYIFITIKHHQQKKGGQISSRLIYVLLILYYANIILFGIYLGVWANPEKTAGSFIGIIIAALFLFNIPFALNFCLIFISMIFFIIASIYVKIPSNWSIDIANAVFAGTIALILNWQITMKRMSLASFANRLEDERDAYYDQSTIDELTKCKNRRDFMITFKRFLSRHRETDNYLCLGILDIDFFKNYNDYYGHPKGDDCLRNIGKALNDLQSNKSIYTARIGGEEFALIWFEEDAANADNIASYVNKMIYDLQIPHEKSIIEKYITVSIGIHIVECGASNDLQTIYDLADKALYTAKNNGRNRSVITLQGNN